MRLKAGTIAKLSQDMIGVTRKTAEQMILDQTGFTKASILGIVTMFVDPRSGRVVGDPDVIADKIRDVECFWHGR